MQTIGILIVYAIVVWAAYKFSKKGGKPWVTWLAFGVAFAAGFMLLGTVIPGWLSAIPGGVVAYLAAAGLVFCLVTLLLDLPDGQANRPAITAALTGPLMFVLGWDTLVSVISGLASGGAGEFAASIG